ncbi:hypothetical protein BJ742DRAFT_808751 [Cladochytrium replicatum]|nr:hypothetical protein BJ742DRAFT_808751 [Cladochytrium replicatum]
MPHFTFSRDPAPSHLHDPGHSFSVTIQDPHLTTIGRLKETIVRLGVLECPTWQVEIKDVYDDVLGDHLRLSECFHPKDLSRSFRYSYVVPPFGSMRKLLGIKKDAPTLPDNVPELSAPSKQLPLEIQFMILQYAFPENLSLLSAHRAPVETYIRAWKRSMRYHKLEFILNWTHYNVQGYKRLDPHESVNEAAFAAWFVDRRLELRLGSSVSHYIRCVGSEVRKLNVDLDQLIPSPNLWALSAASFNAASVLDALLHICVQNTNSNEPRLPISFIPAHNGDPPQAWHWRVMERFACAQGHLDVVKFIHDHVNVQRLRVTSESDPGELCFNSVQEWEPFGTALRLRYGDVLTRFDSVTNGLELAVMKGRFDILKYLRERGLKVSRRAIEREERGRRRGMCLHCLGFLDGPSNSA